MNRNEFIDYLLEKGQCNRFDENQIDAIEQFCFALYDNTDLDKSTNKIAELENELEIERMRLAACGVVANANTRETAKEQRIMSEDYKSASLNDVIRAVDSEIEYRERVAELEKQVEFEIGKKSIAREQRNKVTKRNSELEDELTESVEVDAFILSGIEDLKEALSQKDTEIAELVGFLNHLVDHECISDCSLHREATTLLAKALEGEK